MAGFNKFTKTSNNYNVAVKNKNKIRVYGSWNDKDVWVYLKFKNVAKGYEFTRDVRIN